MPRFNCGRDFHVNICIVLHSSLQGRRVTEYLVSEGTCKDRRVQLWAPYSTTQNQALCLSVVSRWLFHFFFLSRKQRYKLHSMWKDLVSKFGIVSFLVCPFTVTVGLLYPLKLLGWRKAVVIGSYMCYKRITVCCVCNLVNKRLNMLTCSELRLSFVLRLLHCHFNGVCCVSLSG